MSKNAIVVTNVNFDSVFKYTLPFFEEYSKKTGADLIVIDKKSINVSNTAAYNFNGAVLSDKGQMIYPNTRFETLQAVKYFDSYDRIFLLDCDVLIKPNCPNYFNTNPKNIYISRIDLYNLHWSQNSIEQVESIQSQLGKIDGWKQSYFNCGVMMLSKLHSKMFTYDVNILNKINGETRMQNFYNWNVKKHKLSITDMGPKFNYFRGSSTIGGVRKEDAYILHYTGYKGKNSPPFKNLVNDSNYYLGKITLI